MAQQPVRVVVEHRRRRSGCGTVFLVLLALGLAIKFWYVSVGLLALLVVLGVASNQQQKQKALEAARRRPGPRNPWLNEVAVALADLGLTETGRNSGRQLGGAPLEGDIGLTDERLEVYVNLFADGEIARQAEVGLRANPKTREAVKAGRSEIKRSGRIVYVANGKGSAVDDFRLDEVMRTVGKLAIPSPLHGPEAWSPAPKKPQVKPPSKTSGPSPDALEQLRKLGELRDSGVLTQSEFEAKKAELLKRV